MKWKHCLFRETSVNWKTAPTVRHSRAPSSLHYAVTSQGKRSATLGISHQNSHNDSHYVDGVSVETDGIVVAMIFPIPHGITACAIPNGTPHTAMQVFFQKFIQCYPWLRLRSTMGFTVPRRVYYYVWFFGSSSLWREWVLELVGAKGEELLLDRWKIYATVIDVWFRLIPKKHTEDTASCRTRS